MRRGLGLLFVVFSWPLAARAGSAAAAPPASHQARGDSAPRAVAVADTSDSVYALPPVEVRGRRPTRAETLQLLPGQVSVVDVEAFRTGIFNTAALLDRLPGLTVRHYGDVAGYATASIRGASATHVLLYLDGVPLGRAGFGVTNLAELPFASLDHLEVYRGFAPPGLPGSSPGGAIQLVTPRLDPKAPPKSAFLAAAGSFGSSRIGWNGETPLGVHWRGLFVVDALRSDGDFDFLDDHGTPLQPADDQTVPRRNNAVRHDEALAKVGRVLGADGRLEFLHQWVRREQGVPGYTHNQTIHAQTGSTHHLTSAALTTPALWRGRSRSRAQVFFDWRRDTFTDLQGEIGLAQQDNRDMSQAVGAHLETSLRLPAWQRLALYLDGRRESFMPWRGFKQQRNDPEQRLGPEQERRSFETSVDGEWLLGGRARAEAVLRWSQEDDRFAGDLRNPYSTRPARAGVTTWLEPRAGLRLRLVSSLHVEGSAGRYHRSPGFLELFGDGGSIAGSSDLVAESGTNRDVSLDFGRDLRFLRARFEVAHFRNEVEDLISYVQQSQRIFVARNIGAASMEGEEYSWHLAASAAAPRWLAEGNYTRLRAQDLGPGIYAGKTLPGRPEHQLYARLALRFGALTFGYDYQHLGRNYLDRFNRDLVERRDLHGLDLGVQARRLQLRLAVRNLTDDTTRDVAGFPVPGRTFSLGSDFRF